MKIPLEFYEILRNHILISDIVRQKIILTKKAGNYIGLCPFHTEKTPSFTVNNNKKFYYCFGCAASGDVIKFNANINGLSYKQSAISLAEQYNIALPKLTQIEKKHYEESDEILKILELANEFFKSQLSPKIITYLNNRGIKQETITEFSIGFAPVSKKLQHFFEEQSTPLMMLEKAGLVGKKENGQIYEIFRDRIIFPIRNIYNKIVGFGGRVLTDALPKYLNSPETIIFQKNEILYGEHKAISSAYKKNYSILVEGYLDVISLHQAGFTETTACLGTAISENHLQKLWRAGDEIILCLDGDKAGIKAGARVINQALGLINSEKKISFIRLPADLDPDDAIRKKGKGFFEELLEKRISLSEMIWLIEYEGKIFKTAEEKAGLEKILQDYCLQIKDQALSKNFLKFFKDQIWQNLDKRHNKNSVKNSVNISTEPDYSEIEMLEYAFCTLLLQCREILDHENIKEFLLTLNFQNEILGDFRDWYFENIINNNIYNLNEIKEIVEKTRFFDSFLLLIKTNDQFLDLSFIKNNEQAPLFWEWLSKKYYLILLKNEYMEIIRSSNDYNLEKATLYRKEILKISKELQILKESFIN